MAFLKKCTLYLYLRQAQFYRNYCDRVQSPLSHMAWNKKRNYTLTHCREKYSDVLGKSHVPKETWEEIKKSIINLNIVDPIVINGIILDICSNEKFADAGISYYKLLEENNCKSSFSVVIAAKYLGLQYLKKGPVTKENEQDILNVYNIITEQCPILDPFIIAACTKGLSKLGKWREIIKMLSSMAQNQFELTSAYSVLIISLLEHDQIELAKKYLDVIFKEANKPTNNAYNKYFEYCLKRKQTFNKNIEDLFQLWRKYGITPSHIILTNCMHVCNEVGWHARPTNLSTSLKCTRCEENLESSVSEEEIAYLSQKLKQAIFTDEIYLISNPNELNNFMNFIQKTKPYDVVIDGLNSSYIHCHYDTKKTNLLKLLVHLSSNNQKVLVIGRKHLFKSSIKQNFVKHATLYLLQNTTQDDPFILYAALESGKGTKLVTDDLMRPYKFALHDAELGAIFKRWQFSHQYMIVNDKLLPLHKDKNCKNRYINIGIQKKKNYWHIPFLATDSQRMNYINDNNWYCFTMPSHVGET